MLCLRLTTAMSLGISAQASNKSLEEGRCCQHHVGSPHQPTLEKGEIRQLKYPKPHEKTANKVRVDYILGRSPSL